MATWPCHWDTEQRCWIIDTEAPPQPRSPSQSYWERGAGPIPLLTNGVPDGWPLPLAITLISHDDPCHGRTAGWTPGHHDTGRWIYCPQCHTGHVITSAVPTVVANIQ